MTTCTLTVHYPHHDNPDQRLRLECNQHGMTWLDSEDQVNAAYNEHHAWAEKRRRARQI